MTGRMDRPHPDAVDGHSPGLSHHSSCDRDPSRPGSWRVQHGLCDRDRLPSRFCPPGARPRPFGPVMGVRNRGACPRRHRHAHRGSARGAEHRRADPDPDDDLALHRDLGGGLALVPRPEHPAAGSVARSDALFQSRLHAPLAVGVGLFGAGLPAAHGPARPGSAPRQPCAVIPSALTSGIGACPDTPPSIRASAAARAAAGAKEKVTRAGPGRSRTW